jgi:hypothetical protein
MMAISHIRKEILLQNTELPDIKPMEYSERMLVLSLGTGEAKHEEKYTAAKASKWGLLSWVFDNGATPLLDVYGDASSDMVDFHVSTLFQAIGCKDNYLRIQVQSDYIYYNLLCDMLLTYFLVKYEPYIG